MIPSNKMKKKFNIEKIPLETLINLFIELYESGVDFVDLSADNSDPHQDKLIILTKEGYINPDYYDEKRLSEFEIVRDDEDEDEYRKPPIIETRRLSDDDIEKLL